MARRADEPDDGEGGADNGALEGGVSSRSREASSRRSLAELQDEILYLLSKSEGNILDDTNLIETLGVSKTTSETILVAVAEAQIAEKEIDETRAKYVPVAVRGAISCALGCPYEGEIAPERVALVARLMREMGVQHIGVADTIGVGTPRKVRSALEAALRHYPIEAVSGHFHDTYGQALANTLAALELGIASFDTSVAGLGGCPYAKGATGNVATEDVVFMLHGMGIDTGIDLERLLDASAFISGYLQRVPNSRAATALLNRRNAT